MNLIPYNFKPRDYQLPFLRYMDNGGKRALLIWHRRSGKDKTCFNYMIKRACLEVGLYYYIFPTYTQGKKALWENMDKDQFKLLHHIPPSLLQSINNTEMKITFKHPFLKNPDGNPMDGSIIRIIGAENIDSIVGSNPVGLVFSEFSLVDPTAWDFLRPILVENGGWAIFNGTPRGKANHLYPLYEYARHADEWFCQLLTADDTNIIDKADLELEKKYNFNKYNDDSFYNQEYFCSFEANVTGSIYGTWIENAEKEGRVCPVAYDKFANVETWWDIGVHDPTAILFTQKIRNEVHIIDYIEDRSKGVEDYIKMIRDKPYLYAQNGHHGPHDLNAREFGTGKTPYEIAQNLGFTFAILPRLGINDGIQAARSIFNRLWIDDKSCARFLLAVKNYHYEYDDKRKEYKTEAYHDWSSHASDALRYLAMGIKEDSSRMEYNNSYLEEKMRGL